MVSLFDIVNDKSHAYSLKSSLPALNKLLKFTNGIYDFQHTAVNPSVPKLLMEYVLCQLEASEKVFIISCANRFPFRLLFTHPRFKPSFKALITSYTTDTYCTLYTTLARLKHYSNALILVYGIYDLLELYKLELFATFEEFILKLQIERNIIFIENMERAKVDGSKSTQKLRNIPPYSDLTKSPILKFEKHVKNLIKLLSFICQNNLSIITGNMTTSYKNYTKRSYNYDRPPNADTNAGRIVLNPCSYFDKYVNQRLVFYIDLYHNSPSFQQNFPLIDGKVMINRSMLKYVFVAKLKGVKIYFDNDSDFYSERGDDLKFVELMESHDYDDDEEEDTDPENEKSALFEAIQQASNRLSRSQVSNRFGTQANTQSRTQTPFQTTQTSAPISAQANVLTSLTEPFLPPEISNQRVFTPEVNNQQGVDTRNVNSSVNITQPIDFSTQLKITQPIDSSTQLKFTQPIDSSTQVNTNFTQLKLAIEGTQTEHVNKFLSSDPPDTSASAESMPQAVSSQTSKSFNVHNSDGVIRIQFLKSLDLRESGSQTLVVDESEDEYLGEILVKPG